MKLLVPNYIIELIARLGMGLCALTLMPFASHAQEQDFERFAPKSLPTNEPSQVIESTTDSEPTQAGERDRVLVDALKGVVLIDTPQELKSQQVVGEEAIVINDVHVPEPEALRESLQRFIGEPVSLTLLDQLTRKVIQHYKEHDYPVVHTIVPQGQDITDGVVQLAVVVGHLGEVTVEGGQHFSEDLLRSYVSLESGDYLLSSQLNDDLNWLGQNPFRSINFILEKGDSLGETDLLIESEDRFPLRGYLSYENSGSAQTGETRFLGGFNWGNVWGLDHQLGYQYTTSNDFDRLQAHSFNYFAPLPWRHRLVTFGSYVNSSPDQTAGGFDLEGQNWQFGMRYEIPLQRSKRYQHQLSIGFDFKQSNNDLQFGGTTVFGSATDVAQLVLGYTGTLKDDWGASSLSLQYHFSPGGITNHNDETDYTNARPLASEDYSYGQLRFERSTGLPGGFTLLNTAIAQVSSNNLLGSEQLGLGGYNSIRGYNEYEIVGDEGISLRNEIRTPQLEELVSLQWAGQLQALSFLDYGQVSNVDLLPGENDDTELMSVGVGLRYQYQRYITFRADYGWQLKDSGQGNPCNSRVHIGVIASF